MTKKGTPIRAKRHAVIKAAGARPLTQPEWDQIERRVAAQPGREEAVTEADTAFDAFSRGRKSPDELRRRRRA